MIATTLEETYCIHIEATALIKSLQSSGLSSRFPRNVLNRPTAIMGLVDITIYNTQSMKHIRNILNHVEYNSFTCYQLRVVI